MLVTVSGSAFILRCASCGDEFSLDDNEVQLLLGDADPDPSRLASIATCQCTKKEDVIISGDVIDLSERRSLVG